MRGALLVVGLMAALGCGRRAYDGAGTVDGGGDDRDGGSEVDLAALCASDHPDLLLHLPFEEEQIDALDSAAAPGVTLSCVSCPSLAPGKIGGGLLFDAAGGQHLKIAPDSNTLFSLDQGFTLSTWVRLDQPASTNESTVISKRRDTNKNSFDLGLAGAAGHPYVDLDGENDSDSSMVQAGRAPELGVFFHLVATWGGEGAFMVLYQDGEEVGSSIPTTTNLFFDTEPVYLSADDEDGSLDDFMSGAIDEVRIFRRALSAGEAAALMDCP